jgi:hypothetical protein
MLFDREKGGLDLRKSTMTAINLATQVLEVARGTRVYFEEIKVTAGKLSKNADHEYRTMELDGVLGGETRVICSLPLRKDRGLGTWAPTDEGVGIQWSYDTYLTAYWFGLQSAFTSPVAVFEAHKQKSNIRPVWHFGHTGLDRVTFKLSELPQLAYEREYPVCDGRYFLKNDPFLVRHVTFSPYFTKHFRDEVERNMHFQRLQIRRVGQYPNGSVPDIAVMLEMRAHLFEITRCQFFAFLWNQEEPSAFTAFIRDSDGEIQRVFSSQMPGTRSGYFLDAEPIGKGNIPAGSNVVYKKPDE